MPKADLRDYLAAERTFLAWIRTGLALMGFGFVVARFGLFLQQIVLVNHAVAAVSAAPVYTGVSLWFGSALIAVGIIVNLTSAWRHLQLVRQLDRGESGFSGSLTQAVATAFFLALVGLAMAIYLFSVRRSAHLASTSVSSEVTAMSGVVSKGAQSNGVISQASNHSVDQTVEKLKSILQAKNVTLFALVDHSGEAEKVGMKMPPTRLLIFGSPKAGTPLMLAAPSIAIDLPLKILVSQDAQGKVWLSYNSPQYLKDRHGLPPELLQNVAGVETLIAKAAG
jgi:uncharacterized protein (DUF302 family)/uncharacterized membrane protein YidH (DUF202 family)